MTIPAFWMKNYLVLLLREHRKQLSSTERHKGQPPSCTPNNPFPQGLQFQGQIFSKQRDLRQSLYKVTGEVLMQLDALLHQFMHQNLAKPKGLVICSASGWQLVNPGAENKGSRQTPGSALTVQSQMLFINCSPSSTRAARLHRSCTSHSTPDARVLGLGERFANHTTANPFAKGSAAGKENEVNEQIPVPATGISVSNSKSSLSLKH